MGEHAIFNSKCKTCGSITLIQSNEKNKITSKVQCIFCGKINNGAVLFANYMLLAEIKGFFKELDVSMPLPRLKDKLLRFLLEEPENKPPPENTIITIDCRHCRRMSLTRPGEQTNITRVTCPACGKEQSREVFQIDKNTLFQIQTFFRKHAQSSPLLKTAFMRFFWDFHEKPKKKGWF